MIWMMSTGLALRTLLRRRPRNHGPLVTAVLRNRSSQRSSSGATATSTAAAATDAA